MWFQYINYLYEVLHQFPSKYLCNCIKVNMKSKGIVILIYNIYCCVKSINFRIPYSIYWVLRKKTAILFLIPIRFTQACTQHFFSKSMFAGTLIPFFFFCNIYQIHTYMHACAHANTHVRTQHIFL
jgi:hypothetical protein